MASSFPLSGPGDVDFVQIDEKRIGLEYYLGFGQGAERESAKALETDPAALGQRQGQIMRRLFEVEKRMRALEAAAGAACDTPGSETAAVARVRRHCASWGCTSAQFVRVPADYYARTLAQRGELLRCAPPHLTKSVLLENTAWQPTCAETLPGETDDPENSRFYNVIVQYVQPFHTEKLSRAIRGLKTGDARLPRKRFHFRLAPEAVSDELTGFTHNAVSPFGMRTRVPTVLSKRCVELHPQFIWMGGGDVDLKLGLAVSQCRDALNPFVLDISDDGECCNDGGI